MREDEEREARWKLIDWKKVEDNRNDAEPCVEDEEEVPKKRRRMSKDQTRERFNILETAPANLHNLERERMGEDCKFNRSQVKRKVRVSKALQFKPKVVIAIGFDERVDITKAVAVGIKGHKRFETKEEEHNVIITYPGGVFAGHVVPRDGTAADIANFFQERGISIQHGTSYKLSTW